MHTARVIGTGALALLLAGPGCSTQGGASGSSRIVSYLATSPCAAHADASSCGADSVNGCHWVALGAACPAGTTCPSGACLPSDPCESNADPAACQAAGCAWSAVAQLCPLDAASDCDAGGFCHTVASGGSGCACVSPIFCPAGSTCPPMECDCSSGGVGGGTCTCGCPSCMPGESCPACSCDCGPVADAGCVSGGTCACACPVCPAGAACPACSCGCAVAGSACSGGPAGGAATASTCVCPSCPMGTSCPPCDCGGPSDAGPPDPCSLFTDRTSCTSDGGAGCAWIQMGIACQMGQPCRDGVCQSRTSTGAGGGTGGAGCVCGCPACPSGQGCPPCSCSCEGAGSGCTPPPATGTPCPALGCLPSCPNGVLKDANGCDTCQCA